MKSYRLTPAAEEDLFDIWSYIASDNLDGADGLESEILDTCQRLAERPDLGHFRRDLTEKPVRFFAVRSTYLIVYDPASEPLEVLRHAAIGKTSFQSEGVDCLLSWNFLLIS